MPQENKTTNNNNQKDYKMGLQRVTNELYKVRLCFLIAMKKERPGVADLILCRADSSHSSNNPTSV